MYAFSFLSVVSAAEISVHLPALEEFRSSHPSLADDTDELPDVMFADRVPSTVRKYVVTGAAHMTSPSYQQTWSA